MIFLAWAGGLLLSFFCQLVFLRPAARDVVAVAFLNIYHLGFVFFFYVLTAGEVTDSSNYYEWALDGYGGGWLGTDFIISIVRYINWFGVNDYFIVMVFFAGLSAFGVCAIYVSWLRYLRSVTFIPKFKNIFLVGLLIPGLHFWTVPVGKDALILFSYGLMALSILGGRSKFFLLFGLVLVILVRPHVGFCVALLLGLYTYLAGYSGVSVGLRRLYRAGLIGLALFGIAFFYDLIFGYLQKYSSSGFDGLADFVTSRQDIYAGSGSGFSADSMPYAARYLLFYLGGIPWAISGGLQLLAVLEGAVFIILLVFTIKILLRLRVRIKLPEYSAYRKDFLLAASLIAYAIILAGLLSYGSGNLGLMVRQRVMVYLPLLLAFLIANVIRIRVSSFMPRIK